MIRLICQFKLLNGRRGAERGIEKENKSQLIISTRFFLSVSKSTISKWNKKGFLREINKKKGRRSKMASVDTYETESVFPR